MSNPVSTLRGASQNGGAIGSLLAVITSVLVLLFILEVGFRVLSVPLAKPVVTINEPHATLGWAKRRGESTSKKTSEYDITFAINDLGLRGDDDLTTSKPAGTKRVLVVGDSFVLGYTVSRDNLFVDLTQAALNDAGAKVQVLNGGTEGYSTDQGLVWLREEGMKFDPDVVVLSFYQNDVYWNGQGDYAGRGKPRFAPGTRAEKPEPVNLDSATIGWMARNTALGGLFHNLFGSNSAAIMFRMSNNLWMPRDEAVVMKNPPASLNYEDCWARTQAALLGFQDACKDVQLLAMAIPSREQVQPESANAYLENYQLSAESVDFDGPTTRFLKMARDAGIATVDPLAALKAAAASEPMYYDKDWHLNPAGNRVLAAVLSQSLGTDGGLNVAVQDVPRMAAASGPMPRWPFVVAAIWLVLSCLFIKSYKDEKPVPSFLKIGILIASVVLLILGINALAGLAGPQIGAYIGVGAVALILGFVFWKSWSNLGTIFEIYKSFVRRGHWYMIPLLVAMLTIGSLLVVASSSPFVAPFIYTLF